MSDPSSSFVANVLKLTSGSVFAQGLGIFVTPILTHLFAPEAFGVAALFISITAFFVVSACLRYELAIMLPKTDEEAANLLGISVFFALVISAITVLVVFFADDIITNLLNAPKLKQYLWMIPIAVLANGLFLAFNCWNSRTKHFGRLSIARVLRSLTCQATKLGAGFAGFVSGGMLIVGDVLGYLVSTSILGNQIWREDRRLFKNNIRWQKMIAALKWYKDFPIYSTWSALLSVASQQLPIFFLAYFFSPKIVGFFALGRQVLNLPMNFIGQAIGQVFFQKASEAKHQGQLDRVVGEVFKRMVSLGMFPFLLLILLGKDLFSFIFGSQWTEAGVYMQILSLWIFFVFISSPLSTLFSVLEAQREDLIFNTLLFLSRAIVLWVGGLSGNPRITVGLFSIIGAIGYCWMSFWILHKAKASLGRSLLTLSQYLLISSPLLAIIFWFHDVIKFSISGTLGIALVCSVFYYALIFYKDVNIRTELLILLKLKK